MNQSRPLLRLLVAVLVVALLTNGLPGPLGKANIVAADDTGIIVEDAASVETLDLLPDQDLLDAASTVDLRFVVEYARSLRHHNLVTPPSGLAAGLSLVSPRMLIEYANSVRHQDLISPPPGFGDGARQVGPRIVVEYAHSVLYYGVERPEEVPEDVPPFSYPLYHPWTDTLGFGQSWGSYYGHLGQDYAAPAGTPVYAVASGEVVLRHNDPYPGEMKGWGNALIIRHDVSESQTAYSQYAHFQDMIVDEGDLVELGQQIGTIGQTGFATGPHLHLEIKDTATLGPGFAGYSFTGDSWTHGGVTYYRPSTFIERYRGFKAGDELAVTGTGGVGLRLRSSPAISSGNILTVMPEGSQVTVIGGPTIAHGYGWWQVQFGGQHGWAAGRYLASTEGQAAPDLPTSLAQYTVDDTPVPPGGDIEDTRIVLKGTVTSPAGGLVKLQVEVRREGQVFTRHTHEGPLVASGQQASVTVGDLAVGAYQWRARAVSAGGMTSDWVNFSTEPQADFVAEIKRAPVALFGLRSSFRFPLVGQVVVFDASMSRSRTAPIVQYNWVFEDGSAPVTTEEPQVMHIYSQVADFAVALEVVDADGLRDQMSRIVSIGEADYVWSVHKLIEDAKEDLDNISNSLLHVGIAADYFLDEIRDADGKLVEAAVTGVVKLAASPLIALGAHGLLPKGVTVAIGEAFKIVVEGGAVKGVDEVARYFWESIKESEPGAGNINYLLVLNIREQINEKKGILDDLRYELISALDDMSPEAQERYVADTYNRRSGNAALSRMFVQEGRFPVSMYDAKSDLNADWKYHFAKDLIPIVTGMTIGAFVVGTSVLFAIVVGAVLIFGETMAEQSSIREALTADQEMLRQCVDLVVTAPVVAQMIENNIRGLLEDVREREQPRHVAGEIVDVTSTVKGYAKPSPYQTGAGEALMAILFPLQAYSQVKIKNTGEETTNYRLYTSLKQKVGADVLLGFEISRELPRLLVSQITLAPGEEGEIKVDYLAGRSDKKPEGEIHFWLLAVSDGFVYELDEDTEKLKTILIDQDGVPIPQEEAAKIEIRECPMRWDVTAVPGAGQYKVNVYLLNSFDDTYTMGVTVTLPPAMDVVSANDGVVSVDTVYWEITLDPDRRRVLTAVVSVEQAEIVLQLTPPVLELYNRISDEWEAFTTYEALIPPDMPRDPVPANEAGDVPIDTELSWTGGDPQPEQQVTYLVCFGTSETPSLIGLSGAYSADQAFISYDPGVLEFGTAYYWKIVAVNDGGAINEGPVWTFTTLPGLEILTTELPSGQAGVAYEATLQAIGGTQPYTWTWTVAEGQQFPPGLSLTAETGLISGIPTEAGSFNFTVEVTDAVENTATRSLLFSIMPAAAAQIAGETREVNCVLLPGVTVTLSQSGAVTASTVSDGGGNYMLPVSQLGEYIVVASKDGYRDKERTISVTEPAAYTVDFVGDHGLVPNAPDMSYVLACINLWQFGSPPCKLTLSTVLAVINAWQFPV